uniref:Transposase_31 domain-containing protein n=1 Tax=Strongyloides stercoralis TaxID=6248 RepID=A0A0K0E4Y0_STRER
MKETISYTKEMLASAELKDSLCGEFFRTMNDVNKDTFLIELQLHFDGANFNKSNKSHQIFSISIRILNLSMSIRNKIRFYIPLAIFYGEQKPPLELIEEKILRSFEKYKFFEKSLFN